MISQKLNPWHGGHFCQYLKWTRLSNIRCFFQRLFAQNKYNVLVDLFFICFRQVYFLTQSYDFAEAIAFAWRPFLSIFQMVSFLDY